MGDIAFDTGLKTFSLNGVCEVSFNPTDTNFVSKLYNAFDTLDARQTAYREEVAKLSDNAEIFDFACKCDKDMRNIIDSIFCTPISDSVFGEMNVYATANGLPVWCNLMLAIIDTIDAAFEKEKKLTNPRIEKYVKKYQKYNRR